MQFFDISKCMKSSLNFSEWLNNIQLQANKVLYYVITNNVFINGRINSN